MADNSEVQAEVVNSALETTTIEETAAADSLAPGSQPEGAANKAASLAKVVDAFAKFGPETINKFLASLEQIGNEAQNIPAGAAASNKASIDTKEEFSIDDSVKAIIKEDIAALFEGEDLKEEFKNKVAVLFESAINLNTAKRVLELEEEYAAKHEEELNIIAENLAETVNTYLDYSVTKFIEANEVAIESSLRNDLTEGFLDDLHALFEAHYVTVPQDRTDIVEDLVSRIEELEEMASAQIEENVALQATFDAEIEALNSKLQESAIAAAFTEATKDLTESEIEKLASLSETVEFADVAEFSTKINILKESHFSVDKASTPKTDVLFEETATIEEEATAPKLDGTMSRYVSALSHTVRK